ncbi:NAD(P)-binding domain-containing protein [Nocardia sp. NPDC058379]|uniref:NAD(P)-binding domain-containing protein n=1 Tax=unclassified Nocardia TaxID=2637762 RepID=UPI00365834D8
MAETIRTHEVVVIGCGLMGSAIARALAATGRSVAAWNRTHSKAAALAADGVTAVRDIGDAIAAAPLVIGCTTGYDTLWSALADVESGWDGTTLVNLTAGTPAEAEQMEARVVAVGARYLDGMIVCYPDAIGTPDGFLCYAGPSSVWADHAEQLTALGGRTRYLSGGIGAAKAMAEWCGAFFVPSLVSYIEAVAFAADQGVTRDEIDALTAMMIALLSQAVPTISAAVSSGEHGTDQATINTFHDPSVAVVQAMEAHGHRALMFSAAMARMRAAIDSGLGERGMSALALAGRQDVAV